MTREEFIGNKWPEVNVVNASQAGGTYNFKQNTVVFISLAVSFEKSAPNPDQPSSI